MTPAIDSLPTSESNATSNSATANETRFDWPLCYDAENFVLDQIQTFLGRHSFAAHLAERMRDETGTLLIDWVDHLVLSAQAEPTLRKTGFTDDPLGETRSGKQKTLWHPHALLPRVILDRAVSDAAFPRALAVRVESISAFMAAHGIDGEPEGDPLTRFRHFSISSGANVTTPERRPAGARKFWSNRSKGLSPSATSIWSLQRPRSIFRARCCRRRRAWAR